MSTWNFFRHTDWVIPGPLCLGHKHQSLKALLFLQNTFYNKPLQVEKVKPHVLLPSLHRPVAASQSPTLRWCIESSASIVTLQPKVLARAAHYAEQLLPLTSCSEVITMLQLHRGRNQRAGNGDAGSRVWTQPLHLGKITYPSHGSF